MFGVHYSFHKDSHNGFYCKEEAFANPSETLLKIERCLSERISYTTNPALLCQYPNPFEGKNIKEQLIAYTRSLAEEIRKISEISRRILVQHDKTNAVAILQEMGWYGNENDAELFLEFFTKLLKCLIDIEIIPTRLVVYLSPEESLIDVTATVQRIRADENWELNYIITDKFIDAIQDNDVCLTQCYELMLRWNHGWLNQAIAVNAVDVVDTFLQKELQNIYRDVGMINDKFSEASYLREISYAKNETLYIALTTRNEKIIDKLIQSGISIECSDPKGCNALARAINEKCQIKVIEKLLEIGAKIEANGISSFVLAMQSYPDALPLIAEKADLTYVLESQSGHRYRDESIASMIAADWRAIDALKRAKRNVNFLDKLGFPPLYYAIKKLNTDNVKSLLDGGADPNFHSGAISLFDGYHWQEHERRVMVGLLLKKGWRIPEERGSEILQTLYSLIKTENNSTDSEYNSTQPETVMLIKYLTEKVCVLTEETWNKLSDRERERLRPLMMHKLP